MGLTLLLWLGIAAAEDPPPPPPPPPEGDAVGEMVVYGDILVARTRKELDQDIRMMGYREGQRKDGKTIYRPDYAWHPTIIVDDDGYVIVKRSPVRFEPPGKGPHENRLRYLWCLPPFTPMCVKLGPVLASPARMQAQKGRVVEGVEPAVARWRDAIVQRDMTRRVDEEVPDLVEAAWMQGLPIEQPGAPALESPAARKAELLRFWAGRACNPEGEAVAEVVADFLLQVVQESPTPLTVEEVRQAEQSGACGRKLALPPAALTRGRAPSTTPAPDLFSTGVPPRPSCFFFPKTQISRPWTSSTAAASANRCAPSCRTRWSGWAANWWRSS